MNQKGLALYLLNLSIGLSILLVGFIYIKYFYIQGSKNTLNTNSNLEKTPSPVTSPKVQISLPTPTPSPTPALSQEELSKYNIPKDYQECAKHSSEDPSFNEKECNFSAKGISAQTCYKIGGITMIVDSLDSTKAGLFCTFTFYK